MTSDHIIYIPVVLMVGFVLGFVIGRRSLLAQIEARREQIRRRKARREARSAEEPQAPEASEPTGRGQE